MGWIHEQLSKQLADWEIRGRGWNVWPAPVFPEPQFRPFRGYKFPSEPVIDDGRKPTFLSSLIANLSQSLSTKPPKPPPPVDEPEEEPELEMLVRNELVELQISIPAKQAAKPQEFARILSQLTFCQEPVAFEIIATAQRIITQFVVHPDDVAILRRQIKAHLPEAAIIESTNVLQDAWTQNEESKAAIVEFGLHQEFFTPLAAVDHDPFVGLIGAMAELGPSELAVFQVIFSPVANDWAGSINRALMDGIGKPIFVNAPELTAQAERKTSSPLFAAVVRIATQAGRFHQAWLIARNMASTLSVFSDADANELIPLENEEYPFDEHWLDVVFRQSRRSGMILNLEELIGFVHLPSADVREPKLVRETGRTKAAPKCAEGLLLGTNTHGNQTTDVRLTPEQRAQHMHVIGVQGSGKSSLLFNMIRQDLENGQGFALLDPHGDLVEQVLAIIPPDRIDDVVLIDPADPTHAVGFNILLAHSDLEKRLLASDLVSVFQRTSTTWGDQMNSVLQNAIMAFLDSSRGGTLVDLRRFLLEPAFRHQFLATVSNANVLYYWKKGFAQLSGNKSIGPVITRLDTFLEPKPICHMVCQRENRIDFSKIMDSGKIFLAKLSQGQIGKENSFLLGSLFVGKFQQTAMSRQEQSLSSRRPFWLYIDEFHYFSTPTMSELLSGVRKYQLGLVLAHQELRQLQRDPEVASAVLSNPYTRVCFRLGDEDARKLADGFSFFEARDLQNLDPGQAICRLQRSDCDFNLSVSFPQYSDPQSASPTREAVVKASREKYSTPREVVNAELVRSMGLDDAEPTQKTSEPPKSEVPKQPFPKAPDAPRPEPPPIVSEPVPLPVKPSEVPKTETPPYSKSKEGRGGEQHTTIQMRIKAAAIARGFGAETENETPDGKGSADLVIKNAHRAIACEISVTTTIDHEFGNVAKCIKAGFLHVAVISSSPARLKQIEQAVKGGLGADESARVGYYSPDAFIAHTEKLAKEDAAKPLPTSAPSEKFIRGHVVRVHKPNLTYEEDKEQKKPQISLVTANVLRSRKKKKSGEPPAPPNSSTGENAS